MSQHDDPYEGMENKSTSKGQHVLIWELVFFLRRRCQHSPESFLRTVPQNRSSEPFLRTVPTSKLTVCVETKKDKRAFKIDICKHGSSRGVYE